MLGEDLTLFVRAITQKNVRWQLNKEEIAEVEANATDQDSSVHNEAPTPEFKMNPLGLMLQLSVLGYLTHRCPTNRGRVNIQRLDFSKVEIFYAVKLLPHKIPPSCLKDHQILVESEGHTS